MTGGKILIVEDDNSVAGILKLTLERERYVVVRASDGYEALYKYVKEKPSMIILDVMLPGFDGYEVCREIRRGMHDYITPIIMTTGMCEDYDRIKGRVVGATQYLTKPFKMEKLLDEIRNLLLA